LGGSNSAWAVNSLNDPRNLYTETHHHDNSRAAGLITDSYWANGTQGGPQAVAETIVGTGQVRGTEDLWWDVEHWDNPSGRIWTPAEVEAHAVALHNGGIPFGRQGIYLNQNMVNNGGYARMAEVLGLRLWLALYTDAEYALIKGGWTKRPVYWQFTSGNIPALRSVYDSTSLDVNRSGVNVWTVKDLQLALNKVTGSTLDPDNDYGDATKAVVRSFQKSAGLYVDGDAGGQTIGALVTRGA
jgi:hypothetical protein